MIPYDAVIRDRVYALLVAANTLAGARVWQEHADIPPLADLPMILVMIDSSGQNLSTAGGSPTFEMTGDLLVSGRVAHAKATDVVAAVDTLAGQITQALVESSAFLGLCRVLSVRLGRTFRADGDLIVGEARLVLSLAWRDLIVPIPADLPWFTGADMTLSGNADVRVAANPLVTANTAP